MEYNIAVIRGDGIGPEIAEQGIRALNKVAALFGHKFIYDETPAGGVAIDEYGDPLPDFALEKCKAADAVLLAAVGGEKWDDLPVEKRPERGLLRLRGELGLFANLRPAVIYNELKSACPLKDNVVGDDLDIMVVRELTGDVYFGEKGGDEKRMYDVMNYNDYEVERVARVAFELARGRKKKVVSVDKANVLATSRLWRDVVVKTAKDYPDIELSHMFVDNAAMQLVRNPRQFDVLLTGNLFGDILSDEASMITGSIGMLPSASLGAGKLGMYEPIHGSAPDIAGQDIANPLATILCVAMMLRMSFDMEEEASAIESAVDAVIGAGMRTKDLDPSSYIGTVAMGDAVLERMN
ncbi:MAG TPA: 3-isopropylmalate dehydrogenase [Clostridiales bacterium]|nr:3-isopropylmalate dehydrogenase [Clostridiales bacterium]